MDNSKSKTLPDNPRENANPFSILCFCFTMPLFWKGRKKDLNQSDLYKELNEHNSDKLGTKLCEAWETEVKNKTESNRKPNILYPLIKVFKWQLISGGLILMSVEILLRASAPYLLRQLIANYAIMDTEIDSYDVYIYAGGLILTLILNVLCTHSFMFSTLHLGMKLRLALCSMIYRKSLRLSKSALGSTTAGQIVNLLSNDVGRFDLSIIFLHFLWIGPIETILLTYLMYTEIGIAALVGVAFTLALIPFQVYTGKKTSEFRLKTALLTDDRVRIMNEIIQGIQVIKMYAWEIPFTKVVEFARKREIQTIRYTAYIRGILLSFIMFSTRVSIFMSLATYVLLGNVLTAEKAFVISAYYNVLRTSMTVFFPQGISQLAETLVSCKRIEKFMKYNEIEIKHNPIEDNSYLPNLNQNDSDKEDHNESPVINGNDLSPAKLSKAGINISNIKAKWDESKTEYTLHNISLRVQPGTLAAVIGPVGAGKSSLIQAILGELPILEGKFDINGSISYASQEPWLFTGTVRQNILFGSPMDRKRYKVVTRVCALERDFQLLPYGDKTVVGERGASLSGGQKARISLARAVYRKSSIYLLDDPLSAVDTHVGRHLFDQCMREFLRDEIVILVTHQLQFLENVDQIIFLDHGKIIAVGSYDTLRNSGLDFVKMIVNEEDDQEPNLDFNTRRRYTSISSVNSIEAEGDDDKRMEVEENHNKSSSGLYRKYFRLGGGFCFVGFMLLTCILAQVCGSGGDWFLSFWVKHETVQGTQKNLNLINETNSKLTDAPEINGNYIYIYIFTGITVATVVITLLRSFLFFNVCMKASQNLHNHMFEGIIRATMYFFNTNPSGRILNRFSKDMGQIDEILPVVMIDVIQIFLQLFGIVIVVATVNVTLLIPLSIIAILFYFIREFYLKTSRSVKRIESVNRSPIYSHLATSLNGLTTIRAFENQNNLIREFDKHQDLHSSTFYMFLATSRAFGFWLDILCVLYVAVGTMSFFIFPSTNSGEVGLTITQLMGLTGMVQWGMRQSAEMENIMTSVERVVEYENIKPEGELEAPADRKPPKDWPQNGRIKFNKLSLRYFPDPNAELVLKLLDFEISPREKIGIVGRTGAGKSSLINALFRLSYTEGSIVIDGTDIEQIGLHDLRSKISIIPQEPVLFSGTMRYNLDPFEEYSDHKLWEALEEVELKTVINELPHGLQSNISEGGSNFSVGQRQLVCLARAVLRESKILVLDEATANVDPQTDNLIQHTIRNKFKDCTVLTIAHRLHTIMDSNKVLVMDAGQAVEFGTPYELLTESETKIFLGMVQQLGKTQFDVLLKIAEEAHNTNVTEL